MTTPNNIEEKVKEFDAHLSKSAPSMNKFEKASALNNFRTALTQSYEQGREEERERILKRIDRDIKDLAGDPWAYGNNTETTGYRIDELKSLKKFLQSLTPKD